jgi:hypothetical protein
MRVFVDEGSRYGQADIEAGSEAGNIEVHAKGRLNRPGVTGAWRKLAFEVLTALGETRCHHSRRHRATRGRRVAGDDHRSILEVSEAVQWCAGAISHREAARLRQLAAQAHNNKPENDSTMAAHIRGWAHKYCRRTWSFGQLPRQDAYARTPGRFRRLTGGRRRVPACQLPTGSSRRFTHRAEGFTHTRSNQISILSSLSSAFGTPSTICPRADS